MGRRMTFIERHPGSSWPSLTDGRDLGLELRASYQIAMGTSRNDLHLAKDFPFFSENPAPSMYVLNTIIPLLVEKVTITTLLPLQEKLECYAQCF